MATDVERAEGLKETLARLRQEGVDVDRVTDVLKQAQRRAHSHRGEEMLSRRRESGIRERDRMHRDVRGALDRLQRWIQQSIPPSYQHRDTIDVILDGGQSTARLSFGTRRVVRAARELQQALKAWPLLARSADQLPPFRRARRGRPPATWIDEARAQLKQLHLDKATIDDLLWAAGFTSTHPAD